MRTPLWAVSMACGVLLAMGAAPLAVAAEPTLGDNPNEQQMQAYVSYWVGALRDAKADANVLTARVMLVEGYKKMEANDKGYSYADKAGSAGSDALSKGFGADALAKVKEINLAMALSQMPKVSIQPALEILVASKDPAVRLFGWRGYRAAREKLLLQGPQPWTRMAMTSVGKAAQMETSAPVLDQVFTMLEMTGALPNDATQNTKDAWNLAQSESLAALTKNWRRWCQQVLAGDEELAGVCASAARAVASHADWIGPDKAQRAKMLQMIVDMAYCAATGFIQAKTAGQSGDTFGNLMRECENVLNATAKTAKDFIKKPLEDPRVGQNLNWVLLWVVPQTETRGMMAWVDFLKDQGVVEPKVEAPAPTPPTAPAGTPPPTSGK